MYAWVFHCNLIGRSITKVLFNVRYTKRQITALGYFAITKTTTKIAGKGRILLF